MAKRFYRTFALAVAGIVCLLNTASAQTGPARTEMGKDLQAKPATDKLGQMAASDKTPQRKASSKKKGGRRSKAKGGRQHSEFFILSRLLLGDAILFTGSAETDTSSFDPALLARIFGAQGREWIKGQIFVDYGGGYTETLSIGGANIIAGEIVPLSLSAGMFSPLSGDSFSPISRSPSLLTVAQWYPLDEITGFESDLLFGTYSGIKGQRQTYSDSTGKNSGTPFAYSYARDNMSLKAGISWINDLADANGISKAFEEAGYDSTSDRVSGVNLNLGASYRAFTLTGGYIRAVDTFAPVQLSLAGNETEASAWTSELAYTTELLRRETVLAVEYQKTSESLKIDLPEVRYITKASMLLLDGTTLSLEYYLDKDYSVKDEGTDEEGYGITTKIGLEF